MLLALSQMSPDATAFFFVVAFLCLILTAFGVAKVWVLELLALGLALYVLVYAWNALAAT